MAKIETLEVTVKYRVGLGGLDVPKKVFEQLSQAIDDGKSLGTDTQIGQYEDATSWLMDKIRERDCMDWECEIDDLTTPD